MKIGRNAPCPCGSGKKYKRCCLDKVQKKTVHMNPNFTMDDLNAEIQRRMVEQTNSKPKATASASAAPKTTMADWTGAEFNNKEGVTISTPADVAASPVMRYLEVILEEAMSQGGSFKVTAKGNLPLKVVKAAQALLPEFAVANANADGFTGSNEERFGALRYARAVAELAGIVEISGGRIRVAEEAQQQYQAQGVKAFFMLMLEAAVTTYEWSEFDTDAEMRKYWLFMLWRLQDHKSVAKLADDVKVEKIDSESVYCFVERFSQFWGFVTLSADSQSVELQPLLGNTFKFSI